VTAKELMATIGSSEKTSVQVAIRIRPIVNEASSVKQSRFQRPVVTTSPQSPNQVVVVQGEKKQCFNFDYVFGPEAGQSEVYGKGVEKLVHQFLEAYGQTSSGKTHTMGTANNHDIPSESKGIIPRAISTLFKTMNSSQLKSRNFSIKVSFIEIYNEDLIDLFADNVGDNKPQVTIREDSKGNIIWNGLQEIKVNGVEDVMSHLSRGSQNRQVGATDMNAQSSRSHAIFSVTMTQYVNSNILPNSPISPTSRPSTPSKIRPGSSLRLSRKLDDNECVSISSKFHFVDLAGERAKEGISINSGLLALGNVISALGDPTKAKHITHIPYRDSKLTRLLQDSLGGNARTLMIACVSPTESNLTESLNTLKYANRARNIKNTATVNSEEVGWNDLDHLRTLVLKLRKEIKALKSTSLPNGLIDGNDSYNNSGRNTPTMMSGRNTPTMMSGRNTPTMMSGRNTPSTPTSTYGGGSKRSSTSLSIVTNADEFSRSQNDKDIEMLEEQLIELQRSYAELSQKYAKTSAELAIHQENMDSTSLRGSPSDTTTQTNSKLVSQSGLESITEEAEEELRLANFQKVVEPVIEEYEKSISNLESQLALARAALSHTETVMQEQESKLAHAERINDQNIALINDLRLKIANLTEHESTNEGYIRDLERKLEAFVEGYISDLESRLKVSEEQVEKF
ncbi:17395_t:CDS:2, partial [Racocetra persica]